MTREQVAELMESSKTEEEWNANCNRVKENCGGDYPTFWWEAIQMSGLAARTRQSFMESAPTKAQ